jgi:hypothetical protein
MSDGWAVSVKMKVLGDGESTQTYYARLADAVGAEEAVKRHIGATPDVRVKAEKMIPGSVFDAQRIAPGGVGQWI